MKQVSVILIFIVMITLGVQGQEVKIPPDDFPFADDDVLVMVDQLAVHASPDINSPIVAYLFKGLKVEVWNVQNDWAFIAEDGWGWVQYNDTVQVYDSEIKDALERQVLQNLSTNPNAIDFIALGNLALIDSDLEVAVNAYTEAINIEPDNGLYFGLRSKVFRKLGNYKSAIEDANVAIASNEVVAMHYVNLAFPQMFVDLKTEAMDTYLAGIAFEPQFALLYANLGSAYKDIGAITGAIDMLNQGLLINEISSPLVQVNLAVVAKYEGKYEEALEIYDEVLQDVPMSAYVYGLRGGLYAKLGLFDQAIADFQTAVKIDPDSPITQTDLAITYMQLGDFEQAENVFTIAESIDPTYNNLLYNKAAFYADQGEFEKTIDLYSRVIESGDKTFVSYNPSYAYRGQAYFALGDYDAALDDLYEFTFCCSDHDTYLAVVTTLYQGLTFIEQGDYEVALEQYQYAFWLDPEYLINYASYDGRFLTRYRTYLITELQRNIASNRNNAEAYFRLGNLYLEFAMWSEAIEAYRDYLQLNPQADEAFIELVEFLEESTSQ